ncbi:MAG: hypothetical protein Q8P64_08530 [Deltaproteobacteria bacterium]|nr:hypothetical protein [Deltaproteobacteria bacterium]
MKVVTSGLLRALKTLAPPEFIRLRQDTLSRFGGTAERNGEATAP